ncbi:glycosyltransferase family 2 protein [Riemerella anatipestifer]|uniref:glycosyltransferase family 2 protein n=1 Tax=Riemerella anatipestifer TaxID=34085 RepID=UPI0030BD76FA
MNISFTIFTPTYNRAHTLPRVYESLVKQTSKNFEWLIVDDGSTDDTQTLIKGYIEENKFPIRYYKQSNQGKHIAINNALLLAKNEFMITLDSDDYLVNSCIETCNEIALKIEKDEKCGGFTYIHFSEQYPIDKTKYGQKEWTEVNSYDWEFPGEMSFVFKTKIAKKYPFPVYKNEKFCQESVMLIPITEKYKILFTDHVLAHGDYLEDGLSQNLYRKLIKNPNYALLSFRQKMKISKSNNEKQIIAYSYWDIFLKNKRHKDVLYLFFNTLLNFPIKWTLFVFVNKVKKKLMLFLPTDKS